VFLPPSFPSLLCLLKFHFISFCCLLIYLLSPLLWLLTFPFSSSTVILFRQFLSPCYSSGNYTAYQFTRAISVWNFIWNISDSNLDGIMVTGTKVCIVLLRISMSLSRNIILKYGTATPPISVTLPCGLVKSYFTYRSVSSLVLQSALPVLRL
jgi:hypothetical protein